jgi:radical SAM protein with 4Fe4S-binding SPASM domain
MDKLNVAIDIIPETFKLQWHITERCNFRCSHCYQDKFDTPEMSLGQMEEILEQYVDLLKKWEIPQGRAFLTITGGEPFLYKDFWPFLAKVYKYSANYNWAILSNGSLLNQENIKILKLFKISGYQVSLEGLEENNDKIRGRGNFKKAIDGLKILIEAGIPSIVSMTITKENVDDVFPLAELLTKIGVRIFWVRRLVPWGKGAQLINSLLTPKELSDLYRNIEEFEKDLIERGSILRIPPACENSFLRNDSREGEYCAVLAGRILALLPNGDVYPCRRLPIKVGNILENSFEEIYYSDKMKELRDITKASPYCRENCSLFNNCFGGAKCITYAYSGRLDIPDVQCPKAYPVLDKNLCVNK